MKYFCVKTIYKLANVQSLEVVLVKLLSCTWYLSTNVAILFHDKWNTFMHRYFIRYLWKDIKEHQYTSFPHLYMVCGYVCPESEYVWLNKLFASCVVFNWCRLDARRVWPIKSHDASAATPLLYVSTGTSLFFFSGFNLLI